MTVGDKVLVALMQEAIRKIEAGNDDEAPGSNVRKSNTT